MKPHLTLPVIFLFVTFSAILLLSRYIIKPSEHQGSQESIEGYLIASELTEADSGVLAIIVIADKEN